MRIRRLVSTAFLLSLVLLGVPGTASAFEAQYFDDNGAQCDVTDCAGTEIRLVSGQTQYVRTTGTNVVAYFKANSGQLTVFGGHFCPGASARNDYIQTGDWFDTHGIANGENITRFSVNGQVQYGQKFASSDSRCGQNLVFNLTGLPADPHHPGYFMAQIAIDPIDQQAGEWDGIQNMYYLQETGSTNFVIAQQGGTSGREVTTQQTDGRANVTYYIRFGTDCSIGPGGVDRDLSYYDIDNDGGAGAQLNGQIEMVLKDADTGRTMDTWTPPSNSNATGTRRIHFEQYGRYVWEIRNVYINNTMQFSTPFDGIFYELPCPGDPTPEIPIEPLVRPIFKTTGGDVVAGVSMAGPGATPSAPVVPCAAAQSVLNAGIVSWNNHGAPNFAGAGGEYAAMALGQVKDFVTGQGTGRQPANAETNLLTFSNTDNGPSVDFPSGVFGGLFGHAPCIDYWEDKPANNEMTVFAGGTLSGLDGVYRHTNRLTIDASTIPAGSHITIYSEGDVSITGDIRFAADTWTDRQKIPSLRIIANGAIFVSADVTRLDGLYAAIPNANARTTTNTFANPIPGTISTCSIGFESYDPNDHLSSGFGTPCNKRLTVNGSLVAHQLWLLRSAPGLATNQAAETINYTPEMWLSVNPGAIKPDMSYQSIIGLPPVL